MNIATFSVDNKRVIFFFLLILIVGGVVAFGNLPKKEDAPFVIKQAMIFTSYPGASPQEVERVITEVIEREVQSLPYLYKINSYSYFGLSKISVELQPYTPIDKVQEMWDILRRKILNISNSLPSEATVSVNDDFGDVYGIYYGLTADSGYTYEELREWAMKIKAGVNAIDGVQRVTLSGEQNPVVNVSISLSELASLGITPNDIARSISAQNKVINPGSIEVGVFDIDIYADGTYQSVEDIANQLITTPSGGQIHLSDIATVTKGYLEPAKSIAIINKMRAIGVGVAVASDKDVVAVGKMVRGYLDNFTKGLPAGLELITLYPEDMIAEKANNQFISNLVASVAIVIVILMFVMGFRASILIGSSIIFSIGGTLFLMEYFGAGLNRTSLAGFIIAMGMLVDNAIVVTDNAMVAMRKGVKRREALINGATSPQWGLLGATMIAIFSFLPLFTAKASVAEIVKPLFIVVGISLALSWILAITQTTSMGDMILKNSSKEGGDPYNNKFYRWFERFITKVLARQWLTVVVVVVIFVGSLGLFGKLPQNFFPNLDKEYFRADCIFPNGYTIEYVERDMSKIEDYLLSQSVVKRVSTTFGGSPPRYYLVSAAYGPMPNYANILIELHTKDSTKVVEERFNSYVRSNYPNITLRSALFKVSPVPDAEIELGYMGENIDTLMELASRVEQIMQQSGMVDQVRNSWGEKVPIISPSYSQMKGQRVGVTRQAVAEGLSIATQGAALGLFRDRDQLLPIMLKDRDSDTFQLEDLANIPIFSLKGDVYPLSQVVDSVSFGYNYEEIRRSNRQRIVLAQAEPKRNQNAKAAFLDIYNKAKELPIPNGYTFVVKGTEESQVDTNSALAAEMPLAGMLILTTLILLFRSYRKPLVIILMIPLIIIGVVLGLFFLGKMFDFFCLLGLLGLVGMNIKNSIVMIDEIAIQQRAGNSHRQAVINATKSRVVPVAMASGTTILGMVPLLGDAMFGGMAATIMGGLLAATLLTIVVLPVVYSLIYRIKNSSDE